MTGMIEQAAIELEKITPNEINDLIAVSKKVKKNSDFSFITSIDDFRFQLGNSKLVIETDQGIE